eukprot:gene10694-22329_t
MTLSLLSLFGSLFAVTVRMDDFTTSAYKDPFIHKLVKFVGADEFQVVKFLPSLIIAIDYLPICQNLFESFFVNYALEFTYDEEHKLRYFELYEKFHAIFEDRLQGFCNLMNISQTEFFQRCKTASKEDEKAAHYINILLSSVEYETFVKLMRVMRPVAERRSVHSNAEDKSSSINNSTAPRKSSGSKKSTDEESSAMTRVKKSPAKDVIDDKKRSITQMDEDDDDDDAMAEDKDCSGDDTGNGDAKSSYK